jgi:hypothetical protein
MATGTFADRSASPGIRLHRDAECCVGRLRSTTRILLVGAILLARLVPATASEDFLDRDGVDVGVPYGYSDGGEEYPGEEPARWELPGPFSLLETEPSLQTLVFGPTFRNEESRTEVGAAAGYVNSRWAVPFQVSVEATWVRRKRQPIDERNFRRVRLDAEAEVWRRSSTYERRSCATTSRAARAAGGPPPARQSAPREVRTGYVGAAKDSSTDRPVRGRSPSLRPSAASSSSISGQQPNNDTLRPSRRE